MLALKALRTFPVPESKLSAVVICRYNNAVRNRLSLVLRLMPFLFLFVTVRLSTVRGHQTEMKQNTQG